MKLKPNFYRIIPKKFRAHKRATVIAAYSVLFLIMAIGVVLLNQRVWSDYSLNNNHFFDSSKTEIGNALLQISPKNGSNTTEKLKNISQIQINLAAKIKAYCTVSPLISWQRFINQYSNKIIDCEQRKERLDRLLGDINGVVKYLKSEQELALIITTANKKTNQNNQPDKWKVIEAFWRQAETSVSKMTVTDKFKGVKTLAGGNITRVADIWKQLSIANEAKNRQQFEQAHSNLVKAYAELVKIGDNGTVGVKKLITDLNSSYGKTY